MSNLLEVIQGDCHNTLKTLPNDHVQVCVTSPPYWGLRDYGHDGQIGLEPTPEDYVEKMVQVFREVRRVLKDDGTLWLNLGDSYIAGSTGNPTAGTTLQGGLANQIQCARRPDKKAQGVYKSKDLAGVPWMVAFALRADGWYLRSDIIWNKPNPMPESVTDRPTKAHEYLFLLSKSADYYYDHNAIKEPAKKTSLARAQRGVSENHKNLNGAPGQTPHTLSQPRENTRRGHASGANVPYGDSLKGQQRHGNQISTPEFDENKLANKKSVWTVPTCGYSGAHFATFPPKLIEPCIKAGSKAGDIVLDPFAGSGTTGKVALELGRRAILIELNPEYLALINERCTTTLGLPGVF